MKSIVKRISRLLGGIMLAMTVLASSFLSVSTTATAESPSLCPASLDVVLVFDRSVSMSYDGLSPIQPLADVQNATVSFIDILDDSDDKVGLVDFADSATLINSLTFDHTAVSTNVQSDVFGGWTNTAAGIDAAHAELTANARDNVKKAIIVLSDGNPTLPLNNGVYDEDYARDEAYAQAAEAKADGIEIYTIAFGNDVDATIMQTIASVPSNYYFAPTSGDLEAAYAALASDVCQPDLVTISASKVVCDDESLLPNWSGQSISITETTAADYVAATPGCSLEDGWYFQWGDQNVSDPGGDYYGEVVGQGWTTFGPTVSGNITTDVDIVGKTQLRVREVLQNGYIPFTYPPTNNATSAEMYCNADVLNYDNFDFITSLTAGETYHCVAFNAQEVVNTPPVITLAYPSLTLTEGDSFDPYGGHATADDVEDGDITNNLVASSSVNTATSGTYYVDYDVTDSDGAAADTKTLEVIVEPQEPPHYGPYCGDGEVNQWWEKCDSGNDPQIVGCSVMCQPMGTPVCSEDVFAKVTVTDVQNKLGTEGMTGDVFLGTSTLPIPSGVWFPVYYNGSYVTDESVEGYEDVPGLAVQRTDGQITVRHYGSVSGGAREHVEGNIEFYNAGNSGILGIANDTSDNNQMENWGPNMFDTKAIAAGKDAAWTATSTSYFWMTVTTADDSYFTTYDLPPVCEDPDEYATISATKIVCENESYLPNWGATATPIDQYTVDNFLATDAGSHCSVVDWEFQWAPEGTSNPGDNTGSSLTWTTFSGTTLVNLDTIAGDDYVWVREVWNDAYVPFTGSTTTLDESAEMYCHTDTINYDNYDRIDGPLVADTTYYCVAFNAQVTTPPQCMVEGYKYDYDTQTGIAGWTIGLAEVKSCENDDEAWADFVVDYSPVGDIMADRDDPTEALGVAERSQGYDFVSLGRGGEIVLGFDNLILNGAGDDIEVVETTWGNHTCDSYGETAKVYASQTGLDGSWEYLGQTCLDGTFDLLTLQWAKYVKIVDVTVDQRSSDGFDVDGVRAIYCGDGYDIVATTVTDIHGAYCFDDVAEGDYVVFETTVGTGMHIEEVYVNGVLSLFNTDSFFDVFVDVRVENGQTIVVDFYNQTDEVNNPPVITLAYPTLYLTVGDSFDPMDRHATTSDPDGDEVTLYASSTVDTNATGTYAVDYTAEDEHGAWATPKTLEVIVQEGEVNNPPVITLATSTLRLTVGDSFDPYDGHATADDVEDGDITNNLVASSSVNTATSGTYYVDYDVTDSDGAAADTKTLEVIVEEAENQPPVITLAYPTLNLNVGNSFDPMGGHATADDAEDGDLTGNMVATSTVDTSIAGSYTVEYGVEDSEGLKAVPQTLTVVVSTVSGGCTSNCGGGGFVPQILTITNEKVEYLGNGEAKVTWNTNLPATSQVVYGDESIVSVGAAPSYGYDSMTAENTTMVTSHSMTITGLVDGKQYWFRPVSDRTYADEKYGKELTYTFVTVPGQCNYLLEFIQLGANNNPVEVRKLEVFLNDFEGENLEVNGIYEQVDFDAVERFQEKYFGDILGPWGHNAPTGYVYITTKKKINELYCEREFPLTTLQETEIAAFNALLESITTGTTGATGTTGVEDIDFSNVVGLGEEEEGDTTLADAGTTEGEEETSTTGGLLAGILGALGFGDDDETESDSTDGSVDETGATTTDDELMQGPGAQNLAAVVFGGVMSVATSYWFIFLLAVFAVILFLRIRGAEKS